MMNKHRGGVDWTTEKLASSPSNLLDFLASQRRDLATIKALILAVLGIAIPLFVLFRGVIAGIDTRGERAIVVALLLAFIFLQFGSGRRKSPGSARSVTPLDLLLFGLALGTGVYTVWGVAVRETTDVMLPLWGATIRANYLVGAIVVAMVLEATRRTFGWPIVILALFFLIHSLTASYWPGPFRGATVTWSYMLGALYEIEEGVYGTGAKVLLSMILPFLLFGSLVVNTRVGAVFMAMANSLVGRYSGGPAKVAVLGSALFASITGSGMANVATTGCVTIPMMKSAGYKPYFAGAVESCASAGSYFTPPIMGATAFLIAVFTGTPYIQVCLYAAVPAVLFYLGVFAQVHFRAKKDGLLGLPEDRVPSLKKVLGEGGHLLLPIALVVVGLALGYSITMVAIWAIFCLVLLSFVKKETSLSASRLLATFEETTISMSGVAICVVAVGIIQCALMTSGLGMRLSLAMEYLARDNLILGLLLAAVISIILGMGVNPLLVYIILYIFVIPALIQIGAPVLSAHIFALIYGALAGITPPVAMIAYMAASIARASPWRTGFEAFKLGFAAYLVPFLLVLYPALMLGYGGDSTVMETGLLLVTTALGILSVASALEGWLLKSTPLTHRFLIAIGGMGLLSPSHALAAAGFGLVVLVFLRQKLARGEATWI